MHRRIFSECNVSSADVFMNFRCECRCYGDNDRIVYFAHYDLAEVRLKPSIYVMWSCRRNACIAHPLTQGYRAC